MIGSQKIHHRPYIRPNDLYGKAKPYICRIAPFENGFTFEWLDNNPHTEYNVFYGKRVEEVLFLDDNYNADKTAKESGMAVCGVYDKSSEEYTEDIKKMSDFYIYNFKELL